MTIHQPVVAGAFYPAEPERLSQAVAGLLARVPDLDVPSPKALILPHAGYRFSGAVAAAGAARIGAGVRRVVVLGPSHRHAFKGAAVPPADALATPLGPVPVDADARAALLAQPDVAVVPEAFAAEHAIEVELPFLQTRLGAFTLVPLVIGDMSPGRLAEILRTLWGGSETLIVVSTDLTHFLTAEAAGKIDAATASAIERADGAGLTGREACGHRPLAAFLRVAAEQGLRLTRLALTHSGAVTGDMGRVVGYGAWMAHGAEAARLAPQHRAAALRLARQTLESRARKGRAPAINLASFPAPLQSVAPAFVTLTHQGRLRGCIGSLQAHQPLARDILTNAVKAGFEDPRFRPTNADDIAEAKIEIAILSSPAPMAFADEADLLRQLRPARDGLILRSQGKRGTFLPKVWESLETPEKFLTGLKVKAGLAKDHWADDVEVLRYVAESFAE
ncbi:MAG: AmmeMemoRadiSam system protein B [Pseudomonadota bacterium]